MNASTDQKINRPLLLVFGVVVIVFIGYVLWRQLGGESITPGATNTPKNAVSAVKSFPVEALNDPRVLGLRQPETEVLAEQVGGVPTDANTPPLPDQFMVFDPKSGGVLYLSWKIPEQGKVQSWRVYRGSAEGSLGELLAENLTTTRFEDRSVENGITYYYTVLGITANGDQGEVALQLPGTATDQLPPASPRNVSVKDLGESGTLEVSWDEPEEEIAGINIYRSELEGALGDRIVSDLLNATTYRDEGLVDGKSYYYAVTAVDPAGNESPTGLAAVASGRANPFERESLQGPVSEEEIATP